MTRGDLCCGVKARPTLLWHLVFHLDTTAQQRSLGIYDAELDRPGANATHAYVWPPGRHACYHTFAMGAIGLSWSTCRRMATCRQPKDPARLGMTPGGIHAGTALFAAFAACDVRATGSVRHRFFQQARQHGLTVAFAARAGDALFVLAFFSTLAQVHSFARRVSPLL